MSIRMKARHSTPVQDDVDPFVVRLNTPDAQGRTLLRQAAFGDDSELISALLRSGANPNLKDAQGMSPLQHARAGDVAQTLITWGADPEVRDKQGQTPLHHAAFDPVRYKPYEHFANRNLTHALIASGANVDAVDRYGRTPLHLTKDPTTVSLLVQAGADVTIRDSLGRLPTDGALQDKLLVINQKGHRAMRAGSLDSVHAALDAPSLPVAPRLLRARQRC
jgi:ankyrin repeat protein